MSRLGSIAQQIRISQQKRNMPPNPNAPESSRLEIFGFGRDVDSDYPRAKFPSGWASQGVTLREKRMLAFIDSITDKPDWETKVFDEAIVKKWREEANVSPEYLNGDVLLSEKMFDFVCWILLSF